MGLTRCECICIIVHMHDCHIESALSSRGLRRTVDRHRILELFSEPRAWTTSEIAARLPGTDLSTVYRNIQTLSAERLVVRAHSHDAEARYESADRPHHDHLDCSRCRAVVCIPCPVPSLAAHTLELAGTCESCA